MFFGGKYALACHFQKSYSGFVSGTFGSRSLLNSTDIEKRCRCNSIVSYSVDTLSVLHWVILNVLSLPFVFYTVSAPAILYPCWLLSFARLPSLISCVFTFCVLRCVSSCDSFSALIARSCGFLACGNTCSAEGEEGDSVVPISLYWNECPQSFVITRAVSSFIYLSIGLPHSSYITSS